MVEDQPSLVDCGTDRHRNHAILKVNTLVAFEWRIEQGQRSIDRMMTCSKSSGPGMLSIIPLFTAPRKMSELAYYFDRHDAVVCFGFAISDTEVVVSHGKADTRVYLRCLVQIKSRLHGYRIDRTPGVVIVCRSRKIFPFGLYMIYIVQRACKSHCVFHCPFTVCCSHLLSFF
jgi:hypothetical protein